MSDTHTNTPIVHLDPDQRAAIGRAARAEVRRSSHAEWTPAPDRRDPAELLTDPGGDPRRGAGAAAPRAHAGVAVHLLPRRRGGHGGRPRLHSPTAGSRVQACGDAHLSNFGGFASPERALCCSTSTTSTRPTRVRSSGTSSVSSPASRSRRVRGPSPRRRRRNIVGKVVPPLPRGDDHVRGDDQPRRLVRAARRRAALRRVPPAGVAGRGQALREEPRQGAGEGQHEGVRRSSPSRSTVSTASRATRR